jgi:hypothetical protein
MTECFWCNEVFDEKIDERCPKCASDLHTKEITIIQNRDEE